VEREEREAGEGRWRGETEKGNGEGKWRGEMEREPPPQHWPHHEQVSLYTEPRALSASKNLTQKRPLQPITGDFEVGFLAQLLEGLTHFLQINPFKEYVLE